MYKNYNKNAFTNIIAGGLIILFLSIGFIPNLSAVDKIAPQWLFMSILNGVSLIFLAYNQIFYAESIKFTLRSFMSLTYIGFIIWASLSYFYAINSTEVLVNIARQVNVLFMYLLMGIFLYSFKHKIQFISWTILLILVVEVYAVIIEAQNMIDSTGVISSGTLKGVTANRNITAFSIAIKLPFVLYLIYEVKKVFYKVLLSILIFLSFLCLSMIQSRASFIGVGIILIGFFILNCSFFYRDKKAVHLYKIGYILIPLVLSISANQFFFSSKGADVISRASTISFTTNDGSVNQRLRYYEDVLTHLKSNPILGVGLGNWKLKSIEYDAKDIKGYVVPYHAHSDFIQLGAELGIIGFILYLLIFLWAIYFVYSLVFHSNFNRKEKTFVFLLSISLGVYLVDANLNFPIARPQVLVVWSAVMSLIGGFYQKSNTNLNLKYYNKLFNKFFLIVAILIIFPILYVNNKVYKSLKGQMFLLQDFNSNQYNLPLSQVENIVPEIPNITVTTIPINSVKARYYFNAKKYNKALSLLDAGTAANPYLYYSEILKSQIFEKQNKIDSAKFYARKAFYGLPNNELHSSKYLNLISITRDSKALDEAFDLLVAKNKLVNWKNYLIIAQSLYPLGDEILKERAKLATEIFPENKEITALYQNILIGQKGINESRDYSAKGLKYFDAKDYLNAALEFEKALEANPLDYAHYENAATANYLNGNLNKALEQINYVINEANPLNGKCEYIKALIFIKLGDPVGACPLLITSKDSGFTQANGAIDQYCR